MTETPDPTPLSGLARSIDDLFESSVAPGADEADVRDDDGADEVSPVVDGGAVLEQFEEEAAESVEEDEDVAWVGEAEPASPADTSASHPGHDPLMRAVATYLRAEPAERVERTDDLRAAFDDGRERGADKAMMEGIEALVHAGARDEVSLDLGREALTPEVAALFAMRLADETAEEGVRADLIPVLAKLGPLMAEAIGEALATAQNPGIRRSLIEAIVALGEDAQAVLERMVEDSRWFVVRNGVAVLGQIGDESAVEYLTTTLAHDDTRVRRETLSALTRIGGENAEILITGQLADADPDVRSAAARGVGILKIERGLRRLVEMLESESDEDVIVEICRAMGQLGDPSAVNGLEKRAVGSFFSKPPTAIRVAAYQGLAGMSTPRAKQLLEDALEDKDPEVRRVVRSALRSREG